MAASLFVKINRYFFQPGRLVFIIVINTSCSGICYRIYARQKFLNNALAPNGTLALFGIFAGRISCNKCPHTQYLLLHQQSGPSRRLYVHIDRNEALQPSINCLCYRQREPTQHIRIFKLLWKSSVMSYQ